MRTASQIPASGTYVATGALNNAVYNQAGEAQTSSLTAGAILYDMGKTVFVRSGALTTRVLRKVQVAPFESNNTFVVFYIQIGGSTGTTSPVARL